MEELSIELRQVEVSFQNKDILYIDQLAAYQNEHIGVVGKNGQGKSTLLNVISGRLEPNSGAVNRQVDFNYFQQIEKVDETKQADWLDSQTMGRLKVPNNEVDTLSGGEETKFRLAQALSQYRMGLLMDEPTAHLDQESVQFLIEELRYYYGTLIVVSHDRYFLDQLVTKIWEVENGMIQEYDGNYSEYLQQKEQEKLEKQRGFEKITKEKKRLEHAVEQKKQQAQKISQVTEKQKKRSIRPDRLSSSKQKDTVQKNIQKTAKAMEKRIEQLGDAEAYQEVREIQFPISEELEIHNRFPIMGTDVELYAGSKLLLKKANFQFPIGKRIAITGENGSGKSTLLNYILSGHEGITLSTKIVFSTYQQMSYKLTDSTSLLDYLMKQTEFPEKVVRSVLNNLGFSQLEITKPVNALSGGEATRVSMALLFVKPSNVLVLDEPTNFIDIQTIVSLEKFIKSYPGTVIFTSHDQYFVDQVADQVWIIKNQEFSLVKENLI